MHLFQVLNKGWIVQSPSCKGVFRGKWILKSVEDRYNKLSTQERMAINMVW